MQGDKVTVRRENSRRLGSQGDKSMSGNITRRGRHSWRLKFEAGERDPITGERKTRYVTVRGTKRDAQRELTRQLAKVENGTAVDPSRVTVAEYLRGWLDV